VTGSEPGVRRLCAAVAGCRPDLLAAACRSGGLGRMYVLSDPLLGLEVAVAPPGVDEVWLVRDLVRALRRALATEPWDPVPALLALHVGIVRVIGDGFGGAGLARIHALAGDRALRAAAARSGDGGKDGDGGGPRGCGASGRRVGAPLAVAISDGLFADLRAEGLPGRAWRRVPAATAWIRPFAPPGARRPDREPDKDQDLDSFFDRDLDREIGEEWT
jgi:hypothetical protein